MRFRTKLVEIEAKQFNGSNFAEICEWGNSLVSKAALAFVMMPDWETTNSMFIDTDEGRMEARSGDWIICGLRGEFYPCKPDVFEKKYEPV